MAATSTETTQGNAHPTDVSDTLPSYSTGVNTMDPPNICSMEPTTAAMPEENPLKTDTDEPQNQPPVQDSAGMAVASEAIKKIIPRSAILDQ